MLDSKIMMTHYFAALLFSDEARTNFVAPNLSLIPDTPADLRVFGASLGFAIGNLSAVAFGEGGSAFGLIPP